MRYLILILALAVTACSKDEKSSSPSGTYLCTFIHANNTYNGTVTVNGNKMDIAELGLNRNDIDIVISGSTLTFPYQSFGGYDNWTISKGSGNITNTSIIFTIEIHRWGSYSGVVKVSGSK